MSLLPDSLLVGSCLVLGKYWPTILRSQTVRAGAHCLVESKCVKAKFEFLWFFHSGYQLISLLLPPSYNLPLSAIIFNFLSYDTHHNFFLLLLSYYYNLTFYYLHFCSVSVFEGAGEIKPTDVSSKGTHLYIVAYLKVC